MRKIITITSLRRIQSLFIALTVILAFHLPQTIAQCPPDVLVTGLKVPIGTALTNQGNLLVSETGTSELNSGRISIVDPVTGNRRTLLDGLPTAFNDVNELAGPHGIVMQGRTLYVAIGVGDVGIAGPLPGTAIPNPNPVSSPIYSSVLAIHFSANVEKNTTGFLLTPAHQQALANGQKVTLSKGGGERISIQLVVNFPNYISFPIPPFPDNVQLSNPFDMVLVANTLYVTDGGRNLVWQVDINTGSYSELVSFPNMPNPLFPEIGGPFLDPVPTGIAYNDNKLLVALFRGFPFPPGTSTIQEIDPVTGDNSVFIAGLRTAIGIMPLKQNSGTEYLVLQHNSGGTILPPFIEPGALLHFETPSDLPTFLNDCLARPTSMALDKKSGKLYVSELAGRVVILDVSSTQLKRDYLVRTGIVDHIPNGYVLEQNFPNPFFGMTRIRWQSPESSWQSIKIYDLTGREVATLVDEYRPAGNYEVIFDASHLPEGTYFCRLEAGAFTQIRKLLLMK